MINQDIFLIIESSKLNFTAVDKQISEYFLSENLPIKQSDLANKINVSNASVTRFCKKIGFNNYKEFIYCYKRDLLNHSVDKNNVSGNLQCQYNSLLSSIDDKISFEDIKEVCHYIHNHNIIHVYGLGLSAIAGEDFKFRFTRIGKFIEVVRDYDSIEMISSLLNKNNLVLYFSLRGENPDVINSLKNLKAKEAKLIVITANQDNEIVNDLANITLITSDIRNPNEAEQISAQLPILIVIDLIYSQYIRMYRENIEKWIGTELAYLHLHNES